MKQKNFKVCLYLQNFKTNHGSGIGKALEHQKKALKLNDVSFTTNPSNSYHILHINSILPKSLKIIKKAKKQGKKIIIHTHTTSEDFRGSISFSNLISHFLRIWLNYFYSHADLLICPSKYTKELLQKYPKLKRKPMKVISNGINIEKWDHNKKLAKKFKKDYSLNRPIVLAVGLIFPRKGIIDFIKIARKNPEADFVWIGKYMKNLVRNKILKKELKNKPNNFLLTGFIDNIIGAYSAGDIFFFPSYEENEGIVVLEAAAMKKAILVRNIPVFKSYLKDGVNCLMASTNKEFTNKINLLLENIKLRKKISENARKLAENKSLKIIGKELKDTYLSLLKN